MAVLARDYSSAVPQLMRDMAIYFIQFRPVERRSLYNCLIHDVQAAGLIHRVGFSTLNYECVLEFAMLEEGLAIDYFGDAGPGSTRVWKLHGSSNMFSHGLEAGSGISYSAGVVFQGGIQAWLDPNKVISHCLAGTGLAPVMSLFMEGKPTSVSPSALQSVQKEWATAILAAKAIICVGVRPHPPDSHVWEPIANSVATLLFVGDETLFHNVLKSRRRSETVYLGSRFNVSYPELMATMMGI